MGSNTKRIEKKCRVIQQGDIVLLILGAPGVGKSTLVNAILGNDHAAVCPGYDSGTKEIDIYIAPGNDVPQRLVLIDTPGLLGDDLNPTDKEVIQAISHLLAHLYSRKIRCSAVVYLFSLSVSRMTGTELERLDVLESLIGISAPSGIIFGTAHLPSDSKERAKCLQRHEDLKTTLFNSNFGPDLLLLQLDDFKRAVPTILQAVNDSSSTPSTEPFRVQQEMVDRRLPWKKTSVARALPQDDMEKKMTGLFSDLRHWWNRTFEKMP